MPKSKEQKRQKKTIQSKQRREQIFHSVIHKIAKQRDLITIVAIVEFLAVGFLVYLLIKG